MSAHHPQRTLRGSALSKTGERRLSGSEAMTAPDPKRTPPVSADHREAVLVEALIIQSKAPPQRGNVDLLPAVSEPRSGMRAFIDA